jgi:SAM-dependent methyltransferase
MKDKCDKMWSEQAGTRELSPTYYISVSWLKKILKDVHGKVLEIGCGDCAKVRYFKSSDFSYVGIDYSDVAVRKAKERGYNVQKKSATSFHFREKFDYIISVDMLEHVRDDEKVIEQCRDNLKSGGKLILTTVTNQKLFGPIDVEAGHFRRYDPDSLIKLIEKNRFTIDKVYFTGFPLGRLYRGFQYFVGKDRKAGNGPRKNVKYVPKGVKLKIAYRILPLILPVFKIDNIFSSRMFGKWSRGIIIIATRT